MEEFTFLYNYDPKSKTNIVKSGIKKSKSCSICNQVCLNHLNLRHHILTRHSTIEERKKEKYYCDVCDNVFFCKYYMDIHMKSKKHNDTFIANS